MKKTDINHTYRPLIIPVSIGILCQKKTTSDLKSESKPELQYLFAQRPIGKPFAGFWEFPGGKIETHEKPEQALVRELYEELAVKIHLDACKKLMPAFYYHYEKYTVLLHVFIIEDWQGLPQASENQILKWSSLNDLNQKNHLKPMLAAASIILERLAIWQNT